MESLSDKARKIYSEELSDYLKRNKMDVSDHIRHILLELLLCRDQLNPYAGSFVKAVVENNLRCAVAYSDKECKESLSDIVIVFHNFSLPYYQYKEIENIKTKLYEQ